MPTLSAPNAAQPTLADQVPHCPPHHWRVGIAVETCKKCGFSRELPKERSYAWKTTSRVVPAK